MKQKLINTEILLELTIGLIFMSCMIQTVARIF